MKFTHYNLGNLSRGKTIEVTLQGNAANVRLLDSSNFQKYRTGKRHQYYGGVSVVHLPDWWYHATATGI